jgi:AmmeMemoRadiSam system protein A
VSYILTERRINIPDDTASELLYNKAGVFVSLKIGGTLRGCIGTISSNEDCIAEEIIQNAISASSCDPRFSPVKKHELAHLQYSVDVLGDAEQIDSWNKLDVKNYGVIVQKGNRRGLLLPNLEGIDTVEKQIDIARQKAGISEDEEYNLLRFKVVRHK